MNTTPENEALPDEEELRQLLWAHADTTAERILERLGGPLDGRNLATLLNDGACLRYPTSVKFTEEALEGDLFAQPVFQGDGSAMLCVLHVHPRYQFHPTALPHLVAYMAAVINYADAADSDLCEHFGAMLVGQSRDDFYQNVCDLADWRP